MDGDHSTPPANKKQRYPNIQYFVSTVTKTCISHKSVRLKFRWNSPQFISSSPLLSLFLSSTTVLHSTPLSSFGFWAQYWRAPLAMAAAAFCSMGHRHALKNLTELLPDRLTVNGQALSLSLSLSMIFSI